MRNISIKTISTNLDGEKIGLNQEDLAAIFRFFPRGIIALDLETTGLSPLVDRVIEIAAIKITPNENSLFQTLINPEIEIPSHTILIHQITDEMVKNAPRLYEVVGLLNDFIEDLPIIAHNAKFDLGFIVMGLLKNQKDLSNNPVYCSCKLARTTFQNAKNHKLKTLVDHLNIELENHHRAYDDALASLKIFIKSLKIIKPEYLDKAAKLFHLDEYGEDKLELPNHLKSLEDLVKISAIVEIKYAGGTKKNEYRPVKLTSLLNTPDGNILYAKCLESDLYKSFKINKIKEMRTPKSEEIQKWLQKK